MCPALLVRVGFDRPFLSWGGAQVRDSITTEHEQRLIAANSPAVLVKPSKDAAKACLSFSAP